MTKSRRIRKVLICAGSIALVLAGGYQAWSLTERNMDTTAPRLNLNHVESIGRDRGKGNLLAIQPWMEPKDYASKRAFRQKIQSYFAEAKRRGFLKPNTVVVLPEGLGFWLVVLGEKQSVFGAKTVDEAMKIMVVSNLFSFARARMQACGSDKLKDALFRFKAAAMAEAYEDAFSEIAREFGATIVAGTILLPNPSVVNGRLTPGDGPLQNVSAVFRPDGALEPQLTVKCFPTIDETPFVGSGAPEQLPAYETPIGKLGVLICADGWCPETHSALRAKGVQAIASPSYIAHDKLLDNTWCGYSGRKTPDDVDKGDPFNIKETAAIQKYGLPGRLSESGAKIAIAAYLRGQLWDIGSDGGNYAAGIKIEAKLRRENEAAFLNVWL